MKLLARTNPARASRALAMICGALALVVAVGCDNDPTADVDVDRGLVDATLTSADRINWPGLDHGSSREIVYTRAFSEDHPIGYWFLGFGQRRTADSFWFCRNGDTECPLDANHRLNWSHIVGHPIFMRIPGQPGFSNFWQMWTVRVPDSYEPDSVKTLASLHRRTLDGEMDVSELITDFGTLQGDVIGPRETILHCALALANTTLARDGLDMLDGTGPMLPMQLQQGWHEGYRINFVDFSTTDGVFPSAPDSESRPLMPFANVYIMWRSCDVPEGTPRPSICDLPGANPHRRSVSEFGAGQDFTNNRTAFDTNNIFATVQCSRMRAAEPRYSPLWKISFSLVDPDVGLIDTYVDPGRADIQSAMDVFDYVERGQLEQPVPQREDEFGNPVPGNDGQIFFNCPVSTAVDRVPYPCE